MGYAVMPYAVSLAAVTAVLDSKDMELLCRLRHDHAWIFEQDLVEDEDEDPDWSDDDREFAQSLQTISLEAALGHLVLGEPVVERHWQQYVYAFELLCTEFGVHLSNRQWSACPSLSSWVTEVDEALRRAGVAAAEFTFEGRLIGRGLPGPLSSLKIEDYPTVGYLLNSELPAVERSLTTAKLGGIEETQMRASVVELMSWMKTCLDRGQDLVCFSH